MTCKLQAYISVYQEGLETEFCVSSYNSDLSEMIEERVVDERVKKSLEPWPENWLTRYFRDSPDCPCSFFLKGQLVFD